VLDNEQVFSGFEVLIAVLLKIEVFYRRLEEPFASIFKCKQSKKCEETLFESLRPDNEGTTFLLKVGNGLPIDTGNIPVDLRACFAFPFSVLVLHCLFFFLPAQKKMWRSRCRWWSRSSVGIVVA
jgi:hypothetical protein